jgi:hypothetical protein
MSEKITAVSPHEAGISAPRQGYGLTVCLLWNKMLIHRRTIRALGLPARVRLLINPNTRHFCVQGCDNKEPCSFPVPREMEPVHDPFYIHSKFLLGRLYTMMGWDPALSYRVFGMASADGRAMDFDLNRSVLVNADERLENDEVPEEFMAGGSGAEETPLTEKISETPAAELNERMAGNDTGSLYDTVRLPGKRGE